MKVNQRYFTLQILNTPQNFLFEQFFNSFLWISIKNWHFLVFKFFPLCGHSVTFNFSDDDDEKAFVLILNELWKGLWREYGSVDLLWNFKVQNLHLQSPLEHCRTDFQGHQNFAEKLNPKIALHLKCSINVNHHYQSSTLMQSAQIVQFVLSLKIIVKYPKLFSFQRHLEGTWKLKNKYLFLLRDNCEIVHCVVDANYWVLGADLSGCVVVP